MARSTSRKIQEKRHGGQNGNSQARPGLPLFDERFGLLWCARCCGLMVNVNIAAGLVDISLNRPLLLGKDGLRL